MTMTKSGSFEYRRQVPAALRKRLGRYEFKKVLGFNESDAIKAWPAFHDWVEQELKNARAPAPRGATIEAIRTAMDDWREAIARLRALGIDPTAPVYREEEGPENHHPEGLVRDAMIEDIGKKYPLDAEGYPDVTSPIDTMMISLLGAGPKAKAPEPTFVDAARLYIATKVAGDANEKRKRLRVDRVIHFVTTALGKDPKLAELTRSDAREVVGEMLSSDLAPATVDRNCNDIRAIIEFGIREFELERRAINHFKNIDIKGLKDVGKADRDERNPFTAQQLKDARAFILKHATPELQLIWRLLEGTGLRVSEATGLEVKDAVVEGELPHLVIRFNSIRRLKNDASRRRVPLLGDALAAAKEALQAITVSGEAPLFPRYGRKGGGDAASAALMKNLRKVVPDPKVTVHSLRHSMQDRMIRAGISEHDRHLILGHAVNGEANRYGSDDARLLAVTRSMHVCYGVSANNISVFT
ncbi:tyrosine-type recombinase/integrase [Rhizobium sp. N731]|uniref:tyrosine-type recombinase/integrase n=1 Tax=Rhizobium sp. N731 TaxID=1703966 RepID=UPI001F0280C6|nr:site-specific integrase [Rhizobium sp. N731]